MNTSSIEPANAGVSSGNVTLRNWPQREYPRPAAASSSEVSTRSSPAITNRYTYTYIVYACTNTMALIPLKVQGGSSAPIMRCTMRVTNPLSPYRNRNATTPTSGGSAAGNVATTANTRRPGKSRRPINSASGNPMSTAPITDSTEM